MTHSIVTPWEVKWKQKIDSGKAYIFLPIVFVLHRLGVKPNHVTIAGLFVFIPFVFIIKMNLTWAFILVISQMVIDGIDGSLARYSGVGSDKGKFVDALTDTVCFVLFVTGLVYAGIIDPVVGTLFAFTNPLLRTVAIFAKNKVGDSDWIIRPFMGAFTGTINFSALIGFLVWVINPAFPIQELFLVLLVVSATKSVQYIGRLM